MGKSPEEYCLAGKPTVQLQGGRPEWSELMKIRGRHYKPSMENDVIGGAQMILRANILHPTAPAMQTISHPDLSRVGYEKLAVYPGSNLQNCCLYVRQRWGCVFG